MVIVRPASGQVVSRSGKHMDARVYRTLSLVADRVAVTGHRRHALPARPVEGTICGSV